METTLELVQEFKTQINAKLQEKALDAKEIVNCIEQMEEKAKALDKKQLFNKVVDLFLRYKKTISNAFPLNVMMFDKDFSYKNSKVEEINDLKALAEHIIDGKALYEVIPNERRLYLDVEGAKDISDIQKTIEDFIRFIYRLGFNRTIKINYIATRNDNSHHQGISSHVIFNIAIHYKLQRALIRDFIMKTGNKIIDPLPYAEKQLLRIPYSMNPTRKYTEVPKLINGMKEKPNEFSMISKLFEGYSYPPVRKYDFHYLWLSTYSLTYQDSIPFLCSDIRDCSYFISRVNIKDTTCFLDQEFDSKFLFTDDIDEKPVDKETKSNEKDENKALKTSIDKSSMSIKVLEMKHKTSSMDFKNVNSSMLESSNSSSFPGSKVSNRPSRFERYYWSLD